MPHREIPIPQLPATDNRPLWDIWLSGFQLPALTVADELGIFSLLNRNPSTPEQVAQDLGISNRASDALLNLLAAIGFMLKRDGAFHLNELARSYLLPESPHYWGGVLHSVKGMPVSHKMILEAVLRDEDVTNTTQMEMQRFTDDWNKASISDDKARSFTAKMHSHGFSAAIALARTHFLEGTRHLLDVGGGSGSYSIAFAASHPSLKCTVADLPAVCPHTQSYIDSHNVSEQVSVIPLDMFRDPFPTGHDAMFLSDILHDWGPDQCESLLASTHESLSSEGQIFIHEVLLEDNKIGPVTANAYSLAMLMVAEGRQFTYDEVSTMLKHAGFSNITIMPSYGYYSLISARKR